MAKITSLTPEQELDLKHTYNEWLEVGRSCAPLDRAAATKVIGDMYEKIGEKRPVVLYFSSPIMCLLAYGILSKTDLKLGESQLRSQLRSQLGSQLRSQLRSQLGSQLRSQLGSQLWSQLGSQLESQFGNYFGGNQWCAWEVFYDFCRRIGVHYKEENGDLLTLWLDQSKNCHWWWPYKGIVLASERHTELHLDEQGRLHNPSGLAAGYSDGWGVYAVHGIRVSKKVIDKDFTWQDIDKESNAEVRRVMIELYGQSRYILDSGTKAIHEDEWGTLYRKEIAGDEPIVMVKVVNSTPEPDGSYKDYFLRVDPNAYGGIKTARAAVASTWRTKTGALAFEKAEDYCPAFET